MQTAIETAVSQQTESTRIECPACAPERKKRHQKTLSVTVHPHEKLFMCHHCGEAGRVLPETFNFKPKKRTKVSQIPTELNTDQKEIEQFFSNRGIVISDMSKMPPMTSGIKYFQGLGKQPAIGFLYGDKDHPYAIKWRCTTKKAFTQDGRAADFYGLSQVPDKCEELIVVEGECDVVALAAIGIHNVLSVPNGAPMKVSKGQVSPEEDVKFAFIWESRELLDRMKKVVLAVDADGPGEALAEEMARRIGRARCHTVKYPEGCKDFTDVIVNHGPTEVVTILNKSKEMPLVGVYGANDYVDEINQIYAEGRGRGVSTGIEGLDELLTIAPGHLSVITGVPSSGKSAWVDQVVVNLARNHDWKFAVASFETQPADHISKLAEILVGKPFYDFDGQIPRITKSELNEAIDWINDHFVFLEQRDGNMPTITNIIDRAKNAVMRLGCRGLIIDPYQNLHVKGESEHHAISDMLSAVKTFAKAYGVHVWFVAHPAKMRARDDGTFPIPDGHHISGSATWWGHADLGITVHRTPGIVQIKCWKSRFKWVGQQGTALLEYDVPTGRYRAHEGPGSLQLPDKKRSRKEIQQEFSELEF
jgi:twinkle protein